MPNPLADEARQMDDAALRDAINEAYREVFNLQFQKGTHQLQDATSIRRARRRIARLRTILRQRELAVVAGAPIAPLAATAPAVISPQKQRALDEREAEAPPEEPAETLPLGASDLADEVAEGAVAEVDLEAAAPTEPEPDPVEAPTEAPAETPAEDPTEAKADTGEKETD